MCITPSEFSKSNGIKRQVLLAHKMLLKLNMMFWIYVLAGKIFGHKATNKK